MSGYRLKSYGRYGRKSHVGLAKQPRIGKDFYKVELNYDKNPSESIYLASKKDFNPYTATPANFQVRLVDKNYYSVQ